MAKATTIVNAFNAGELSPRLEARSDLAKYFSGCITLENMIIMPEGGAEKRPGTYYVGEAKSSSTPVRLIPFVFSVEQSYVLEFGELYIRYYKDNGQIVSGTPVETISPYKSDILFELNFTQSADVLYLAHTNYHPRMLTRTSHTSWTLSDIAFTGGAVATVSGTANVGGLVKVITSGAHGFVTGDMVRVAGVAGTTEANGTWIVTYVDTTSFTLQGSVYAVAWSSGGTAVHAGPFTYHRVASCADNGSGLIRVTTLSTHGFVTGNRVAVEGVVGTTSANNSWIVTYINATTFDLQGSSYDSAYVSGGRCSSKWPRAVSFFEERLMWAGTFEKPQTVWGSNSGDYYNMLLGSDATDGLQYSVLSDQVDAIHWMCPHDYLLIGTGDGEWRFGGSSATDPITPTSVNAKRQSTYGSGNVQGLLINDVVLFVQGSGKKVREMAYSLEKDGYVAPNMTRLAHHITGSGLVNTDYQSEPDSIMWGCRTDGEIAALTYERADEVVGWHRHTTGRNTGGRYESVAVIKGEDEDQVWVSTVRIINGVTKRYIEYFMPRDFGDDKEDAFFVDCGLTFDGGAKTGITAATAANPVVVTVDSATGLANGQNVRITGCFGMTELNDNVYKVAGLAAKSFNLTDEADANINGTAFHALVANKQIVRCDNNGSNLIRVKVTGHALTTGNEINIFGVTGCTEANGLWTITVIDANHFDLVGSDYIHPYLSGGYVGGCVQVVENTFANLGHLEGEEAAICASGGAEANQAVAGGIITLSGYHNKVHIGLPFKAILEPERPEIGGRYGTSQGVSKRIDKIVGRFYKSIGCKIGEDKNSLVDVVFSTTPELFSGDHEIEFEDEYDSDGLIMIVSDQPLPLTVLGIMVSLHGYEGV